MGLWGSLEELGFPLVGAQWDGPGGGGVGHGVDRESLGLRDQREELGLRQRVSTRAVLPLGEVRCYLKTFSVVTGVFLISEG